MRTCFFFFIFAFCIFRAVEGVAQYAISGRVVGHDGKPIQRADVMLLSNAERFPRAILKIYRTELDGTFFIDLPRPGLYRLQFAGVNHKPLQAPIYAAQKDTVIVHVRLAAIRYKDEIKEIVFFTDYDADSLRFRARKKVEADREGIFTARFTAKDSLFEYEIGGIDVDGHTVNGLQADFFAPDRSGDYFSVIRTRKDSTVTIRLDPRRLVRSHAEPGYEIIRAPEETRKFLTIHKDFEARQNKYFEHARGWKKKGIPLADKNDYANSYDWGKDLRELDWLIANESDPFMRQGWYVLRLRVALSEAWAKPEIKVDRELAEAALREIPPDSPMWSYFPTTLQIALGKASEPEKKYGELKKQHTFLKEFGAPFLAYIGKVVASHPDSSIRRHTLNQAIGMAHRFQDYDAFEKYYNKFKQEFAGTFYVEWLDKKYSPARRIRPGQPVPDFAFRSLDNPKQTISKESLLGTNYIINFWALWCGPCKPSLQALAHLYEKHRDANFTILSVSMDYKKEDVIDYRARKLPMPWLHTFLEKWQPKKGVLKDFEVVTIPRAILVGKTGMIVAVSTMGRKAFYSQVDSLLWRQH